jgi:hypothetical protein
MTTVTNVGDQPCRQRFASALSDILVEEGEKPGRAQKVVDHTETIVAVFDYGQRPFSVSFQSGTDYSFFVEKKGGSAATLRRAEGLHPLHEQSDLHPHEASCRLPSPM